jgi:hypothetical protein
MWCRVKGTRSHQWGGGLGYRLTGKHARVEICLFIPMFLGLRYMSM